METNKNSAHAGVLTDERYQDILRPVLQDYGMKLYLNGESVMLDPCHYREIIDRALATRASVDLSGLTRYGWTIDPDNYTFGIKADGDYYLVSDLRTLLATSAAEDSEQDDDLPISVSTYGSVAECEKEHARRAAASVPSVGSIDTPELQNLANTWAGKLHSFYRSERDSAAQAWKALITHIDAHLARQSQAVALLRDAIQKELNPAWECNSYHPAIHAAMSATENLVAPAAQMGSAQATPFSAEAKASWRIQDPPAVVDQLCKATQRLLDAACNHISSTDDSELAKAAEEADRALADCVGDWPAAQADVRDAALEEAAKVCDALESDMFDQYKGRGTHAPNNPYRADPYMNGQSDGAGQCANAIRAMRTSTTAGEGGA